MSDRISINTVSDRITVSNDGQTISIAEAGQRGAGVPAGGLTGQVLAKASDSDYDAAWITGGGGGGSPTFIGLTDTPEAFEASRIVTVNAAGDALEFPTASAARTLLGLGTAATTDASAYATAAQGDLADSAIQFPDLADVAISGQYADLLGLPSLFGGAYGDLTGIPSTFAPSAHTHTLADITDSGTAASADTGDFEASGAVAAHAALVSGVHGISAFGATLVDDANAGAARGTLGLGSAAVMDAGDFAESVHTHPASQITDFATAADARIAAASIGALSDVNLAGVSAGKILEYNGSAWVVIDTPSGGGGATSLGGLSDVTISSPSTAQVLRYNGSGWVNAALAYSDLTGTPSLAAVATSGAYTDLSGLPSLFDGEYGSLGGIPSTFAPAAHTLASHSDAATPTDSNQIYLWDGSTWTAQGLLSSVQWATAQISIASLNDVTIFEPATGQVIRWNGSNWTNAQLAYSDLSGLPSLFDGAYSSLSGIPSTFAPSAHDLNSHSNVNTAPGTDHYLKWTGINWGSANIVAGDVKSGVFTTGLIPNLAASKITSGTFDVARIPNLAASKITSGTFDNARISQASVTQHQAALAIAGSQVSGKQGPGAGFDGGGAAVASGVIVQSPVTEAGTVTACYADADQSGSIDIIVRHYAAADTSFASPTTLGTLSISSARKGTLGSLSQAVAVGDTLEFETSGTITNIERVSIRSRI